MDISTKLGEGGQGLSKAHPLPDGTYLRQLLVAMAAALPSGVYTHSGLAVGDWTYVSASNTAAKADADDTAKQPVVGVVVEVISDTQCRVAGGIEIPGLSGLVAATKYYLSATAGGLTDTAPAANAIPLGVAKNTTTLVVPLAVFGMGAATIRGNTNIGGTLDVTGAAVFAAALRALTLGVGQAAPAAGIATAGPLQPGAYTLATLPAAATYPNALIRVTDASGGAKLCQSDGTNWKLITIGATVS